ncbi:sensor histidine kinase [Actinomadura atramentaria]|uniref:sensor histidine kinase n=1 Tax=Actinomadura atramentaria TaxID=1990 RepID=UPI000527034E|nr:histidine kinase [Actinomadura atramentaria]
MRAVVGRAAALAGAFAAGLVTARLAGTPRTLRLTSELQRSRERILAVREEERRRLRHDLHDDLGPTLASLALTVDAARLTLTREPDRVAPVLTELRDRLAGTVAEIRDLARGLRPPALDDLGLAAAIEALAEGCGDRVDVRFEGSANDLPAAVEVAAYRIVAEAVANIRAHASAPAALILLTRREDLQIVVADSGVGLHPGRAALRTGGGLASMREWAAEVGGHCAIGSRPGGGTVVAARLPLAAARYHRSPTGRGGGR